MDFGDGGEVLPVVSLRRGEVYAVKKQVGSALSQGVHMGKGEMAVMCRAYGSVSLKGPVLMAALLMRMSIDLVIFLVSSTACYPIYITGLRISEIARQIVKLISQVPALFLLTLDCCISPEPTLTLTCSSSAASNLMILTLSFFNASMADRSSLR